MHHRDNTGHASKSEGFCLCVHLQTAVWLIYVSFEIKTFSFQSSFSTHVDRTTWVSLGIITLQHLHNSFCSGVTPHILDQNLFPSGTLNI